MLRVGIDAIAAGGDGVGRLDDGRVVFVPRSAPGDVLVVRPVKDAGRWLRAEVDVVDEASPLRREPPCPLFDRCGGCQLQHLVYPAQGAAKSRIVGDALRRIGGLEVDDPPVEPSPREFGYRNRLSFTLRRLAGGRVVAGFHHRSRPGHIVDVAGECLLAEDPVLRVWCGLRRAWGQGARRLPGGRELRITVRAVDDGALVAVEGGKGRGEPDALVGEVEGLRALWHADESGQWRHVAGDPNVRDSGVAGGVAVAPGAFAQVNAAAAAAVHARVLDAVGDPRGLRIVDAYCGVGAHGWALARGGATVVGLELDPGAVAVARQGAPAGFTVVAGPTEETLPAALPADRVVVNPPRGGLDARVPEVLRERPVPRVVYVSCDPATLARDLARLGDDYRVEGLRSFDLFPQTSHVETVVTLDSRT